MKQHNMEPKLGIKKTIADERYEVIWSARVNESRDEGN